MNIKREPSGQSSMRRGAFRHRTKPTVLWAALLSIGVLSCHRRAEPPPIADLHGHHLRWRKKLPIDGEEIQTPPLEGSPQSYKLLISGYVDTGRYGEKVDAEHRTGQAQQFRFKHDHLRFTIEGEPVRLKTLYRDRVHHQYVYGLSAGQGMRGNKISIRFKGLAYRFRISPAKLSEVSRNRLFVSMWRRGSPAVSGWVMGFGILAVVLALGGIGYFIHRRRRKKTDAR
jgi:hypothetical protein